MEDTGEGRRMHAPLDQQANWRLKMSSCHVPDCQYTLLRLALFQSPVLLLRGIPKSASRGGKSCHMSRIQHNLCYKPISTFKRRNHLARALLRRVRISDMNLAEHEWLLGNNPEKT